MNDYEKAKPDTIKEPDGKPQQQFRRVNWTPECITQGEEGSATLETHAVHANKLEAEFKYNIWLTTVHQHVRSKKSTEKCWKDKTFASSC